MQAPIVKNPRVTKTQRAMFRLIIAGNRLCSTRDEFHRWAWMIYTDGGIDNVHTGTFQSMINKKFIVPAFGNSREYTWNINPEVINVDQLKDYDRKAEEKRAIARQN